MHGRATWPSGGRGPTSVADIRFVNITQLAITPPPLCCKGDFNLQRIGLLLSLPVDIIIKHRFIYILCRLVIGFRDEVRHDLRLAHIFMAGQAT